MLSSKLDLQAWGGADKFRAWYFDPILPDEADGSFEIVRIEIFHKTEWVDVKSPQASAADFAYSPIRGVRGFVRFDGHGSQIKPNYMSPAFAAVVMFPS